MKILVIPDIHETRHYKKYLEKSDEFDRIIFLGDYFDYHGEEPKGDKYQNFLDICEFKRRHTNKVDMLIGNHDNSYLINDKTSSYQDKNAEKIKKVLEDNISLIKIAVEYDGYVFSHAGISKTFMKSRNINSLEELNNLMLSKELGYDYRDETGFGDNVYSSPTWIRPPSLLFDAAYPKQVVGHTALGDNATLAEYCGNKVIFCDTFNHSVSFILDTEKEYHYENAEKKEEPAKVEEIEIVQTESGLYNVFITYNREFETTNPNAYMLTGFKTVTEAEIAVDDLLLQLAFEDGIDIETTPNPKITNLS